MTGRLRASAVRKNTSTRRDKNCKKTGKACRCHRRRQTRSRKARKLEGGSRGPAHHPRLKLAPKMRSLPLSDLAFGFCLSLSQCPAPSIQLVGPTYIHPSPSSVRPSVHPFPYFSHLRRRRRRYFCRFRRLIREGATVPARRWRQSVGRRRQRLQK